MKKPAPTDAAGCTVDRHQDAITEILVQMVADFYDQAHPEQVAERVAGFRRG